MRVGDYISLVEDLESKKRDLETTLEEGSLGYASEVLTNELNEIDNRLTEVLDTIVEPIPFIVKITTEASVNLSVGATHQLTVNATFSDGTNKSITRVRSAKVFFKDIDNLYNNQGFITSIDATGYTGNEDRDFILVRTSTGFDVDDKLNTEGLQVANIGANQYEIRDLSGNSLGIRFTTDGNEAVGDNWRLELRIVHNGTEFISEDTSIATVTENGLITGVSGGTTVITVKNGDLEVDIPITVVDVIAPSAPTNVIAISTNPGEITVTFDANTEPDVEGYYVYLDGMKHNTYHITTTDYTITGLTSGTTHTIEVTAIDRSGNESVKSSPVSVTVL